MYAGSGIWKTIATTTVIVQLKAMRATAAPLPGVGRSSSLIHAMSSGDRRAVYASVGAVMMYSHRCGRSDPRQLRRRIVETNPHGKALRYDNPIKRAADDRQPGTGMIVRLHAAPETLNRPMNGIGVIAHRPHGGGITHRNARKLRLAKIGDGI